VNANVSANVKPFESAQPAGAVRLNDAQSASARTQTDAVAVVPPLLDVASRGVCVTAGAITPLPGGYGFRVNAGGMRAVIAGDQSLAAEVAFTYRGPSTRAEPLANGELRRQIGLKLRAQDTCNVVYVMWHIEPKPGIAVSVKRNANASSHDECGAGGYINVRPRTSAAAPVIASASEPPSDAGAALQHTLRADVVGSDLRVTADGTLVWLGRLPPEAFEIDGPTGIRTDNGIFDAELRVPGGLRPNAVCPPRR